MATIKNTRDLELQARGLNRLINPTATISSVSTPEGSSNFTNEGPTSIALTVSYPVGANNYTSPSYSWEYSTLSAPNTWIALAGSNATLNITKTQFNTHRGTEDTVTYRVNISQSGWPTLTLASVLKYVSSTAAVPIITFTREAILLPTTSADVVTYTNSGVDISVKISGTDLTYATIGPNTFDVTAVGTNITPDPAPTTVTSTIRRYGNLSAMGAGSSTSTFVTYTIKVRDSASVETVITKIQSIAKAVAGATGSGISAHLTNDSAVVATDNLGNNGNYTATPTGVYVLDGVDRLNYASSGTAIGTFTIGTLIANNITPGVITGSGSDTANIAAASNITQAVASITIPVTAYTSAGSVTVNLQQSISRAASGAPGTSPAAYWVSGSVPTLNKSATNVYTPSTVTFTAYKNVDGATTSPAVWFKIYENGSGTAIEETTGGVGQTSRTYTPTTSMTSVKCEIYLESTKTTLLDTEGLSIVSNGATGGTGAAAPRSITISAFKWISGTYSSISPTAATLTWSNLSVTPYPDGFASTSASADTTGMTLYTIEVTITQGTAGEATTNFNWNTGIINQIGYRQDGSIGPTGEGARRAYIVTTSATPPTTPASNGILAPTGGWSFTATSTLSEGQYMYQSDGLLNSAGTVITWGVPYLSNLKVGNLSALAANLGQVVLGSTGHLRQGKTNAISPTVAGVFLGFDGSSYSFDISNGVSGTAERSLTFNSASGLTIKGDIAGNSSINTTGNFSSGGITPAIATYIGNPIQTAGDFNCGGVSDASKWTAGIVGHVPTNTNLSVGKWGVIGVHNTDAGATQTLINQSGGVVGVTNKGSGLLGYTTDAAGWGLTVQGAGKGIRILGTQPIIQWGLNGATPIEISAPSGGTTTFLRNDGTWAAPAGGGGGSVTNVTGTAPISVATGTTTPVVSMTAAANGVAGFVTATDQTFSGTKTFTGNSIATGFFVDASHGMFKEGTGSTATIRVQGTAGVMLSSAAGISAYSDTSVFRPGANGSIACGADTFRWSTVHTNGLNWNGTSMSVPSGTATTYLNGTGTWTAPAGNGTTTNSLTFNNGGAGAASGSTFNGTSAVTISHNTIGAYAATNPSSYIALSSAITGYTAGTNTALAATDTLLAALGKIQGQITARSGTVTSVGAGAGISGGTITTTGTHSIDYASTGTWTNGLVVTGGTSIATAGIRSTSDTFWIGVGGTHGLVYSGNATNGIGLVPSTHNTQILGGGALRWATVQSVLGNFTGVVTTAGINNSSTMVWNGYTYAAPTGSSTTYLANNGTWTTPPGTYTHPASHPPSIITQDASNRFVTDSEKATWNAKGSGTVTSVGAGTGISGGTITTTGTHSIDQAFSPTWSGQHTWSTNGLAVNNNPAGTSTAQLRSSNNLWLTSGTSAVSLVASTAFVPWLDNTLACGFSPGYRWSTIYAVNGTINTSDAREKTEVENEELGLTFIEKLRPVSYKWVSGGKVEVGIDEKGEGIFESRPGVRTFHGLLAQEVKATLDELNAKDFAGWTLSDKDDPESSQGLRYTEFVAPLIKAVQELSAQNKALEARLVALEAK